MVTNGQTYLGLVDLQEAHWREEVHHRVHDLWGDHDPWDVSVSVVAIKHAHYEGVGRIPTPILVYLRQQTDKSNIFPALIRIPLGIIFIH